MKTLILIIAMLVSSNVMADAYINVNVAAYHFNREATKTYNFNEINPGIGMEFSDRNGGYMVGTYKNSIYRQSVYALVSYTPIHVSNVDIGVVAGGVTGYEYAPIVPAIGVLVTMKYKKVGINLMLVPEVQSIEAYGFAGLQLSYKM